jgi:predicted LPLAT superfamily acyltransferase
MEEKIKWSGKTEGGDKRQNQLERLLKHVPLRAVYCVLPFAILYYLIFKRERAKSIYNYLRHRQKFSWLKSEIGTYRNHIIFGKNLLDRFFVFSGGAGKFKVNMQGGEYFYGYAESSDPVIIVSAHVGNYEISAYVCGRLKKPLKVVAYANETAQMQKFRSDAMAKNNISMIPVMEDMSHIFNITDELEAHNMITLPADRVFTGRRIHTYDFFGAPAQFPIGAYYLADRYKAKVITMFVMRGKGLAYNIYVEPLTIDDSIKGRDARAAAYGEAYVKKLEDILRRYPLQWFNFYDFWDEEESSKVK